VGLKKNKNIYTNTTIKKKKIEPGTSGSILATWEAETRTIIVLGQAGIFFITSNLQNNQSKMD
jgi:hypothetical protein